MAEPPPVLYPASPDSEAKVSECAGSQFNVRVGPNYARKGNKSPSDDSMYHLSSVHMFKAESCTKHLHMATRMPLPEPLVPADSPGLPLPQLLVVTLVAPEQGPATVIMIVITATVMMVIRLCPRRGPRCSAAKRTEGRA
mmetsp:Transcript_23895/g.68628  ORF Transcript_23895/g.68628 Transcript_23895/m.68628 type:complete len:140 (-) Transcript_23895:692-1111(-)